MQRVWGVGGPGKSPGGPGVSRGGSRGFQERSRESCMARLYHYTILYDTILYYTLLYYTILD